MKKAIILLLFLVSCDVQNREPVSSIEIYEKEDISSIDSAEQTTVDTTQLLTTNQDTVMISAEIGDSTIIDSIQNDSSSKLVSLTASTIIEKKDSLSVDSLVNIEIKSDDTLQIDISQNDSIIVEDSVQVSDGSVLKHAFYSNGDFFSTKKDSTLLDTIPDEWLTYKPGSLVKSMGSDSSFNGTFTFDTSTVKPIIRGSLSPMTPTDSIFNGIVSPFYSSDSNSFNFSSSGELFIKTYPFKE